MKKYKEKEYDLYNNDKFMKWYLKLSIHYDIYMTMEDLQNLIDTITAWYEFKYPNFELNQYRDEILHSINCNSLSNYMSIEQLLVRLSNRQICLITNEIETKCHGSKTIYENGKAKEISTIFIKIAKNQKNSEEIGNSFLIEVDEKTGRVFTNSFLADIVDRDTNAEDLLTLFKIMHRNSYDYSELERFVNNSKNNMQLRDKILNYVTLKLLDGSNSRFGYIRAKKYIEEFNDLLDIDLTIPEKNEEQENSKIIKFTK